MWCGAARETREPHVITGWTVNKSERTKNLPAFQDLNGMCWNLYETRVTWNQFSYRESLVLFDSSHILSVLWSSKISSCSCFCSCAHSIRWFVNSFSRSFRRCSSRFNSSRSCSRMPRTFRRTCCEFSVAIVGHFEFSVFLLALFSVNQFGNKRCRHRLDMGDKRPPVEKWIF